MKTFNFLRNMIAYYHSTRGVGHTQAVLDGVDKNTLFVGVTYESARALSEGSGATPISIGDIQNGALAGLNRPIVFDNYALLYIFEQIAGGAVLEETLSLRVEVGFLHKDSVRLRRGIERMRGEVGWYRSEYNKVPRWLRWMFKMEDDRKGLG